MKNKSSAEIANEIFDETFDIESDKIRKLGYETVDLITEYFNDINNKPLVPKTKFNGLMQLIDEPLPKNGQSSDSIICELKTKIIDNSLKIGNPNFLGWISSSGTIIGSFADGIAGALNQNVSLSGAGIATAIELLTINWIKEMIGYDKDAAGLLVSGGSVANLMALTVARNAKANYDIDSVGLQNNKKMIVYASKEAHVCVSKAVNILGIGTNNIRWIDTDKEFCLNTNDLEKKIVNDLSEGNTPFVVVATAGNTKTGAVDPLNDIAGICQKYDLWFHVDAAYGGFAILSNETKDLFKGIQKADSIAINPHKWLFIPYEAGCLLVKNHNHMIETFSSETDYIHIDNKDSDSNEVDFSDYGIQLSRNFRALKIWMSLKQYGANKYEKIITQNILLAKYLEALAEESNEFIVESPANLSIVCFRYVPKDLLERYGKSNQTQKDNFNNYLDNLNKSILKEMIADGRAVLSGAILHGKYVLRACIINYRTKKKDIVDLLYIVKQIGIKKDEELRSKSNFI